MRSTRFSAPLMVAAAFFICPIVPAHAADDAPPAGTDSTTPPSDPTAPAVDRSVTPSSPNYTREATTTNGVIKSVDIPAQQVVMRANGGSTVTRTLSSSVSIRNEKGVIGISDLKPGDSVSLIENAAGDVTDLIVTSPNYKH